VVFTNGKKIREFPWRQWLALQFVTIIFVAAVSVALYSVDHMLAVLAGLFIALVPNAIFIWFGYRFQGAKNTQQMVGSFYQGESIKFILTAVLFAVAFMALDGMFAVHIIVGFIVGVVVGWIGSIRL
jgi:ATP synthase protein I